MFLNFSGISTFIERAEFKSPRRKGQIGSRGGAPRSHGGKVRSIGSKTRTAHRLTRPYNPHLRRGAGRGNFICLVTLLLAACFPLPSQTTRADQIPTEYQVKAAYLYNFLKFVEWPDDPSGDPHEKWVIGFIGDSPIGGELARLAEGKNLLGRDLHIKKVLAADSARGCHILFISESEKNRLPSILADLNGSSVLTVADMENFISAGGMIQFVVEDARVRVAIDVGAASRAHLKVSSKLLSLARTVTGTERGANN